MKKDSIEYEHFFTFKDITEYDVDNLKWYSTPYCFNETISIRKRKVTIEIIDEPREVLIERVQGMWDECDNIHYRPLIKAEAKKLNYVLINSSGSKRIKK